MEIFAFCVRTFEPIKVKTCSAPQNDRLNFSFVKDICVVGAEKWLEMAGKQPFISRKFMASGSTLVVEFFKQIWTQCIGK